MDIIRIVLVDDHSIVREGLKMIIENDPQIEVVGEADNIKDAFELVRSKKPDVILLDLDFGDENALDHIADLLNSQENVRILILTGTVDQDIHKQAVESGASGILVKSQVSGTLLKAIKKVYAGEAWIDRTLTARIIAASNAKSRINDGNNHEQKKIDLLTNREREIVKLIAEGLVNKEISERLFLGEKTVRNNLSVIYDKLEVANRLELAIYAANHGLDK
jgi:DNA-binding NarL/FixJ family response regulator